MKKIIKICKIIVSVAVIFFSVYYFITGIMIKGVQPLLLSVLMALLAYEQNQQAKVHQSKGSDSALWVYVIATIIIFIMAIVILFS